MFGPPKTIRRDKLKLKRRDIKKKYCSKEKPIYSCNYIVNLTSNSELLFQRARYTVHRTTILVRPVKFNKN